MTKPLKAEACRIIARLDESWDKLFYRVTQLRIRRRCKPSFLYPAIFHDQRFNTQRRSGVGTAKEADEGRRHCQASTVTKNYRHMRCAVFGLGLGATKEHSPALCD